MTSGYSSRRLARFSQWIVQRYPSSRSERASRYAPVQIAPSGIRRWGEPAQPGEKRLVDVAPDVLARADDDDESALSTDSRSPSACMERPLLLTAGLPSMLTIRQRYNDSPLIRFAIRNGSTALLNAMKV